jgi:predicted flap endonuclease-1-like 5' DNA nuclease
MPSLPANAALLLCAVALSAGLLIGWVCMRLRIAARFVPATAHQDELVALRRRFRRRLRAMRDAATRHRISENELRNELRVAANHQATHGKLLAAAQAEIAALRTRIGELGDGLADRDGRLAAGQAREETLAASLREALERVAALERKHGLMRIERDELAARTTRLRALQAQDTQSATGVEAQRPPAASRTELADRDARIHELECQLRESESRMSDLEANLRTWKYRIAPLALHMEQRRGRAAGDAAARTNGQDDLKRIRGIGRGLEKKLHGEGVTGFAQLAAMSPAELANLAVRVGVAASRPQRDRWAEQARELGATGEPGLRRRRVETA